MGKETGPQLDSVDIFIIIFCVCIAVWLISAFLHVIGFEPPLTDRVLGIHY